MTCLYIYRIHTHAHVLIDLYALLTTQVTKEWLIIAYE